MQNSHAMRAATLAALGWILAVAPAFANERTYPPVDQAFDAATRAQETDPPIMSNGVPVIVGQDEKYRPIIEYQGPQTGNLDVGGVPVFLGNRDHDRLRVGYVDPATAAAPAPTAAAPSTSPATTAVRPPAVPPAAVTLLGQASQALDAREFVTARDRLERAETMLLNARRDGETGFVVPIDDIAAARAAVARHDAAAARTSINAVQQILARGS